MIRLSFLTVALLLAATAAQADRTRVYAVGNGTLGAFVSGHDVIAVGDHAAESLQTGNCLILIGSQLANGVTSLPDGTVIIPGPRRNTKGHRAALNNALWLMARANLPVGNLDELDTALNAALDAWVTHCGEGRF